MNELFTSPSIAVIGSGVVGLSTAVCIQHRVPSATVSILAENLAPDTVSAGAGGIFRPEINIDQNAEKVRKWCKDSLDHFYRILKSPEAGEAGIQYVSGYHLSSSAKHTIQNPLLKEFLPVFHDLSEKELNLFPSEYKNGVFYTTIIADCRYYLPWLKKKFEGAGGSIKVQHVSKLTELSDHYDVVVNCTGLGAKHLVNDSMLVPIRGQTIKVKAPWIKHFYYGDEIYIVPGLDYITLGGVKDYSSWSMKVNPYQRQYIWEKCLKLLPSLEHAEVMWDWVGLRPYRPKVRVDIDLFPCNGKFLKVVHNYGHGAHGVTLSWGTAKHTAELVADLLTHPDSLPSSKL